MRQPMALGIYCIATCAFSTERSLSASIKCMVEYLGTILNMQLSSDI